MSSLLLASLPIISPGWPKYTVLETIFYLRQIGFLGKPVRGKKVNALTKKHNQTHLDFLKNCTAMILLQGI